MNIRAKWNAFLIWLRNIRQRIENSQTVISSKAWFRRNWLRLKQKLTLANAWRAIKWVFKRVWIILIFPFKLLGKIPFHSWLRWGIISVMVLVVGFTILVYSGFLSKSSKEKPEEVIQKETAAVKPEAPKVPSDTIAVQVNGDLNYPIIINGLISVKKGDAVSFELKKGIFKKGILIEGRDLFKEFISPSEIIYLKLPGQFGKYWLADKNPTALIAKDDGEIEVSVEYPTDMVFTFISGIRQGSGFSPAPIEIKFSVSDKMPEVYSSPRQIARINGIGSFLPSEVKIEKKNPSLNLKELSDQSIQDFISK